MKKLTLTLLALMLALTLALPAFGETVQTGDNRLQVHGTATVSLKADQATIEIGAQTRGKTVADAHAANIAIMEKVIADLGKLGIAKEDIRTSQYNVYMEPDNSIYGAAESIISGSFVVNNMVFITIRDIALVSTAIDTAASAGANNIYNLTFQASRTADAYKEALGLAVNDAKDKAEVIALAIGRTLGGIVSAQASPIYSMPYGTYDRASFAAAEAKETPIISGDVSITAEVTLVFGLE